MKTIKQAAGEYVTEFSAQGTSIERPVLMAFNEAVKFAEEWISVEDELPLNQDIVLIKTDRGCYGTGYLHGEKSGFITYGEEAYKEFGNVTHWRPLKRK